MVSNGISRGVAAVAVSALAVAGLPFLAGTAHAELGEVEIVNHRDRVDFDTDELRDNDDFTILTRNEAGEPADEGVAPEYRWVITPADGGAVVTGNWLTAKPRAKGAGRFQVYGPSSHNKGADGIRDPEVQDGSWALQARVGALRDEVTIRTAESEIVLADDAAEVRVIEQTTVVSGTLRNANGALRGREVTVSYTPDGNGDAFITGGTANSVAVVTAADGEFSVTLEGGRAGESGILRAIATGEARGDGTQLQHRTGPDDGSNPRADAADSLSVAWGGLNDRTTITAVLRGRSNGARADRLEVLAPGQARAAEVRLLRRTRGGRLTLVQSGVLNQKGDRRFQVKDRNGRRYTSYVAVVRPTSRTLGDRTGTRRVR